METAYKVIWGLLLFVLFSISVTGQPRCKVEYYSTEQGLSHQRVTAILKDSEGFMWFGSWDGINRFDGHNFVSFKSSPGDMSQLGNDRVDQIVEDQSNHFWIQAYDRQIYRFDKQTEQFLPLSSIILSDKKEKNSFSGILNASDGFVWLQSVSNGIYCVPQNDSIKTHFIRYNKEQAAAYQLPSNNIHFFYKDQDHRIWIGTNNGLCCLVRSPAGTYINAPILPPKVARGTAITMVDEDSEHLYFTTADGNFIRYNKHAQAFRIVKIANTRLNYLLRSKKADVIYFTTSGGKIITTNLDGGQLAMAGYRHEALYSIYEDRTGNLWLEPEKFGVIRFDPHRASFSFFSKKIEDPNYAIGNRFKVFEDNNGLVWVNMKSGGFGYYNTATSSMDYVLNVAGTSGYELPGIVFNLYYDNAGILWLRVQGRELVKIIFPENDFKQQLLVSHESQLSDNEVRGMLYDNKNRLWLGAKSGSLYIRHNDQWIKGLFVNEPAGGIGQVYTLFQDTHHNIWLGTKRNGLFKAIPQNAEGTKYMLVHFLAYDEKDINKLPANQIYAVTEDHQGRIWIGTFDKGLMLALQDGDSVKFVHAGNAFKNYPREGFQKIRHMKLDNAGNIWIATTDGLLVLNTNNDPLSATAFKTYSKIPGDKTSLGNNDIQFIHRDSKNRMWLATSGGGFCLALGDKPLQSLHFRNYTTREGMPNDYVLSCTEDTKGNLWFATENGLAKFNPQNNSFRNYDSYDGLPKLSFSEAATCPRLPDGSLIFGTTDGYITFDPGKIGTNRINGNIVFTHLQINNEDAGPSINGSFLKTGINYVPELRLKYNQDIISIGYAILDYRSGNRQAFAYRLIGFDTTWHDDRQFRRATYTNLPPGHYIFEVKSLNTDSYLNTPYKRVAITILPPPWKTWWAYLCYLITILLVLAIIRRNALAMIRLRNKIAVEQKLAALKLKFFTNVSHELRTPLTLIVNPLEQLSQKEKLSQQGLTYVDVARKNANRMVRFINQLLDLRKVQSDKATLQVSRVDIVPFVKRLSDHFTEAARSKRIKLQILAEQKELIAWVDAEKFDVVIYNLLGNALKFTPEGKTIQISVRSIPEEHSFSIAVHDQGPGVPPDKLEDIFELFNEGDLSAERVLKGSGIGLALSREFVVLHGGSIRASNNEDGGLTVTVKMSLGFDHYQNETVSFVDSPHSPGLIHETPVAQQILPMAPNGHEQKDNNAPLVLLVEDNSELRFFLKNQLSEFYRVETAKDGEEGWQKAAQFEPDLIVSDIMMPVMDGIQMLDKVKNDINTSHIPVVLLTAKYSIESQIEGLKYGADYYITKPFNNEFLIASVDNLLRQRKKLFESLVERKRSIALAPGPVVVTSRDEAFLKNVITTVEEKMTDPGFNIEAVAEAMVMSRTTFYKKFKSLTGMAPVEFVRDMRLQKAKQYLDAGGNNVSDAAYLAGFNNPKYFSTCFKDKYQVSPSDYLKSN